MLLKSYKIIFLNELSFLYDTQEIESFFYILLEYFHQKKRIDLALNPAMEMSTEELHRWENVISELKKEKPIQYILGETEFFGLRFFVNEDTLIPRPETEELVELIVAESKESKVDSLKILDIGTGSGCIAISIAKNLPNSEVYAIDISEKALDIAIKNANLNQTKVNFIYTDILQIEDISQLITHNSQLPTQFDIIVSNPPYVRNLEKQEIKPNVLDYEPHVALFVEDEDALLFYRKIAQLAYKNLAENGKLYFEINQYLGEETKELIENLGFKNIIIHKDIYGNNRILSGDN